MRTSEAKLRNSRVCVKRSNMYGSLWRYAGTTSVCFIQNFISKRFGINAGTVQ